MSKRLYVGNLAFQTTEDQLQAAFAADGREVSEVSIIKDRNSGESRGFGFLMMSSDEHAQAAIAALDGTDLDGRTIKVSVAKAQPQERGAGRRDRW